MELGLAGKVALVAGSSRGLGRAIAEELADEGCAVVLSARDATVLEATRAAVEARGTGRAIAVAGNVAEPSDVGRLVDAALTEFGRVDILVTNAGGPPPGPFEQHTPEAWEQATRLTLGSVLNLCRAVLPGMKERRWGRILNVTSIAAKQPVEGLILSNSIRAAVHGFARTLANEVAPFNITVNNLLPGYTRTERLDELAENIARTRNLSVDQARAGWEGQIPMGRLGEPREFAALAAFLASERASYITGTSIPVDGGWTRGLL